MSKVSKAYNIVMMGDNDAEINMYGEVVTKRPVDWWTREPVEGNFIVLDEFLNDLNELSTKDNITIHINSGGGDMYSGVSIYNRLKALPANIITINDGLAASAASIIFQAGNTRKVNAGSNIMVHQASALFWGYFNSNELRDELKDLDAANNAAVNIYAEVSGRTTKEMKKLVDAKTWLTGQEAVDEGLADEVIENGLQIEMSLTNDKSHMIVNGFSFPTWGLSNIPASIPVMPAVGVVSSAAKNAVDDKKEPKGEKNMEIKNIEGLKAAYPELMDRAEKMAFDRGREEGVKAERARIKGIEEIENAVADRNMIKNAKYGDEALTAEQLAFKAMQAQAAIGVTMIQNIDDDCKNSGVNSVKATPNKGPEGVEGEPVVDEKKEVEDTVNLFKKIKGGK